MEQKIVDGKLSNFAKELNLLQDYILLKFGLDFQQFRESYHSQPKTFTPPVPPTPPQTTTSPRRPRRRVISTKAQNSETAPTNFYEKIFHDGDQQNGDGGINIKIEHSSDNDEILNGSGGNNYEEVGLMGEVYPEEESLSEFIGPSNLNQESDADSDSEDDKRKGKKVMAIDDSDNLIDATKYIRTTKGKITHKITCPKLYTYYRKHVKKNRTYWRCDYRGGKCGASIVSCGENYYQGTNKTPWTPDGFHISHPPDVEKSAKQLRKGEAKGRKISNRQTVETPVTSAATTAFAHTNPLTFVNSVNTSQGLPVPNAGIPPDKPQFSNFHGTF